MAYKLSKWDLSPLYPGYESAELQSAFDMIEEQVTSFEGVRNKLAPDMPAEQFVDVLELVLLRWRQGHAAGPKLPRPRGQVENETRRGSAPR